MALEWIFPQLGHLDVAGLEPLRLTIFTLQGAVAVFLFPEDPRARD
jgi:hypothetical protein